MTKKSLYERLGGYDAISAVSNDLVDRLQRDQQLGSPSFKARKPTSSKPNKERCIERGDIASFKACAMPREWQREILRILFWTRRSG